VADNLYVLTIHRIREGFAGDRYRWAITTGEPDYYSVDSYGGPVFKNDVARGDTILKYFAKKEMFARLHKLLEEEVATRDRVELVYHREVKG
jgi:hypothetical protein